MTDEITAYKKDKANVLGKVHSLFDAYEEMLADNGSANPALLDEAHKLLNNAEDLPYIGADEEVLTQAEARYEYAFARLEHLSGNDFEARKCLNRILRFDPDHEASHDLLVAASDNSNPSKSLRDNAFRLLKHFRASGDDNTLYKARKLANRSIIYMLSDAAKLSMSKVRVREDLARSFYLAGALYEASNDDDAALHMFDRATYYEPEHSPSVRGTVHIQGYVTTDTRTRDFG